MSNPIHEFFARSADLGQLCTQNGWPDNDSLRVEILERAATWARCAVSFEEIVVGGAGCVAGRVLCWGRFRVELDETGGVTATLREM